jgi:hypothetical protein
VHGFLPDGNQGSNLQRATGLKAPLSRALGEPPHASYETAELRTLLKQHVDFRRRPIIPVLEGNRGFTALSS